MRRFFQRFLCVFSPHRFCSDCKHNVVQAHDILMGKIDLEGSENEEEFDEVRGDGSLFLHFVESA